jgi:hypothetical protein
MYAVIMVTEVVTWTCTTCVLLLQVLFQPNAVEGCGKTSGEAGEQLFAALSPLGRTTCQQSVAGVSAFSCACCSVVLSGQGNGLHVYAKQKVCDSRGVGWQTGIRLATVGYTHTLACFMLLESTACSSPVQGLVGRIKSVVAGIAWSDARAA